MNFKPQSSHWYRHNAVTGVTEPCYELPRKNGGGTKAVTLREARELSLLPSVTTVLQVLAKPELTNWLISNGIMAAITLPRLADELVDDFVKRVIEDADQQSETARNFGTRIHDAIEAYLNEGAATMPELEPFVKPTFAWLDNSIESIIASEICVGCQFIGVAGRLDLDATLKGIGPAIIDFKTQKVREAAAFYPEFPLQLVAYARIRYPAKWPALVSVVIDSGKPTTMPHIKVWNDPERYWHLFQCAYELWCYIKGYDPRKV